MPDLPRPRPGRRRQAIGCDSVSGTRKETQHWQENGGGLFSSRDPEVIRERLGAEVYQRVQCTGNCSGARSR